MLNKPSSLTKLLFAILSINLVGLLLGGFYIYKTRFYILSWFNTATRRISDKSVSSSVPLGYYGLKVNEFKVLSEKIHSRKAIIFAGDSMMQGLEWHEHFPILNDVAILKRSIGGETLDRFIDRLELTFSPKYDIQQVFMMIGINDITRTTFQIEAFKKNYHTVIEKLLEFVPAERICLHSFFPTRRETMLNRRIKQVNEYLKAYAIEKELCYIDLYDQLADLTGLLDVKYTYDGLHLSFEGYKIWLEALTPHVLKTINHAQR
jgi:lysophospholipase L1-like esterase